MPSIDIVKLGDRGPQVVQLQQLLNAAASQLLRLRADGDFGLKTHTRVIEFQNDNRLKADGLVGPLTMARLQGGSGPSSQDSVELQKALDSIARLLDPRERVEFLGQAQSLVASRNSNSFAAGVAVPVVIVVMFMILDHDGCRRPAIQQQSRSRAGQRVGSPLPETQRIHQGKTAGSAGCRNP
ncbi:MAG: peptidoglycan-binding protein [Bryobacterales bacterium]|nr:peptidoglycan-binding protein [Bryobacterales bacterium]